jgi:endonuclease/exonuclease/phosphatase family metal-dependent hydrolase
MDRFARIRERQAQGLSALSTTTPTPVLALGDLNAGDLSRAHAIITDQLTDAWRAAGWGFGHTYPGATLDGNPRPRFYGIPVPRWLIRIDYVFCSPEWQILYAGLGPWDGHADHRPVVATLALP